MAKRERNNFLPKYIVEHPIDIPIIYLLHNFSANAAVQGICIRSSNEKLIDFFNSGELNRIINFRMRWCTARVFRACVCVCVFAWNRFPNSLCDWVDVHKNAISKFHLILWFNSFLAFWKCFGISIACTQCKLFQKHREKRSPTTAGKF